MSCGCGKKGRSVTFSEAIGAAVKMAKTLNDDERADPDSIEVRAERCRDCPSRVRTSHFGKKIDWCGSPMRKTADTCGCVVWAKIRVIKEECPQGKW
jgi:hypothetical protein